MAGMVILLSFYACGPSASDIEQKRIDDSTAQADSMVKAQATADSLAAIEKATADSLAAIAEKATADSLAAIEKKGKKK